jgi:hypothetical protein
MASIGVIVRASQATESLPCDWIPEPLGSRANVLAAIAECLPSDADGLALRLRVEEASESEEPRTISASGIWGDRESAVLRKLCQRLGARFYDAEASEFVEI